MSYKKQFEDIITFIRNDLKYLSELYGKLVPQVTYSVGPYRIFSEEDKAKTKEWIFDVFLDKVYEIDSKTRKFFGKLNPFMATDASPVEMIKMYAQKIALEEIGTGAVDDSLREILISIRNYSDNFEVCVTHTKRIMYDTNWHAMKEVNYEDYIIAAERKRYISSREELEKAKQMVKHKQWGEVLNHLRPAIDLAIKEKFGFTRVNPMKQFLIDAERYNLPLPTYTMLYDYFDEGSNRIHSGKLNTPFECQKALEFVAGFIDQLDLTDITKEKIEEFKQKSKCVE